METEMKKVWARLEEVEQAARDAAVSFTLNFAESSGQYYFTVDSPAKEQRTTTKDRPLSMAIDDILEYLEKCKW